MRLSWVVFSILLAGLLFSGCRKGENDPKLSLRSRKARICGDWQLESGHASLTLYNYSELYKFDGSRVKLYSTTIYSPVIRVGPYRLNLHIDKDGTFSVIEALGQENLEASGTWNFTSGVGDEKKNESVAFSINELSKGSIWGYFLFNQWNTNFSYHISELRNKRLVISGGGSIAGYSNGDDLLFTVEYTFKQP